MSANSPHPTSTPLHSSSRHSTIAATDATAAATATAVPAVATVVVVVVSHNNQPGLVVTVPARNNPHVLPLPTSVGKIGTPAILMVVMWMTPTRAHHAGIRAQHTTQMRPAPTSWADQSPECTRPSFPQRAAILLPPPSPPIAAASTATHSSVILPCPGHDATYEPCTRDHAHAGAAARPRHDEFCRTAIPSTKCKERANDAAASSAGNVHVGTLLWSQPTFLLCPQPAAAGIYLTSRGGQR